VIGQVLLVIGIVLFILAGLNVNVRSYNLVGFGLACLTASFLL